MWRQRQRQRQRQRPLQRVATLLRSTAGISLPGRIQGGTSALLPPPPPPPLLLTPPPVAYQRVKASGPDDVRIADSNQRHDPVPERP